MRANTRTVVAAAVIAIGGVGAVAGAALATVAASPSPAIQPAGQYVFACVNKNGQIDYLEFRKPLPHQCKSSSEALWH